MSDQRRLRLLELKRAAKLATPAEVAELCEAYIVLGDGLAVPMLPPTPTEFEAKYGGDQLTLYVDLPDEPPAVAPERPRHPEPTTLPDGTVLCAPQAEPPPAGKENTYRPNVLGRG